MNINIVDAVILLYILLGGVIGFKEGFIKKAGSVIGLVLVVIIAFTFKNKLSVYFYENLPFFNLWGIFKGIQVLNIIFYEGLAFFVIASVLMIAYNLLLQFTGLIEKVLKATVILSIPSKILGFVVGLVENYIWTYVILFILTLPIINLKLVHTSEFSSFILEKTPILSNYTKESFDIYNDIYTLVVNRNDKTNTELNEEAMSLMLDYKVITVESAEKLINKNKVEVNDSSFIEKYK